MKKKKHDKLVRDYDRQKEKQLEQIKLDEVTNQLNDAKITLESIMSSMGKDNLDQLIAFRESPDSGDFYSFLDQLTQKNAAFNYKDKFMAYGRLARKYIPYFAVKPFLACSTMWAKLSALFTASSASILRSTTTPDLFNPLIKVE